MAVERRDPKMEAHLQAIAVWYWIAAGFAVLSAGAMVVFFKDTLPAGVQKGMKFGIAAGLAGAAVFYALGHYLMKFAEGARIAAGGLSALMLLANIVALARPGGSFEAHRYGRAVSSVLAVGWCAALLWALFNGRAAAICSEEYKVAVKAAPGERVPAVKSPFFWVPFILLGVSTAVNVISWFAGRSG